MVVTNLRQYQIDLIQSLRSELKKGNNRLVAQLATGGG